MCRRYAREEDGAINFRESEGEGRLVRRRVRVGVAKVCINGKPVRTVRSGSVKPDSSNILYDPQAFCPECIVLAFFLDEL